MSSASELIDELDEYLIAPGELIIPGVVSRPAFRRRGQVGYLTLHGILRDFRRNAIAELRARKRRGDPALATRIGDDIARVVRLWLGTAVDVTAVACGHSRTSDCLSQRAGRAVAATLDTRFVKVWADRFVSGSSHPSENRRLPPLERLAVPDRMTVVVDDIATSGWHLEEACTDLRSAGVPCVGIAWVGGLVV